MSAVGPRKRLATAQQLSDDARAVAGSQFGMMRPGGRVGIDRCRTVTPRAQAALDELVAAGIVSFDLGPGGIAYTCLRDCSAHASWLRSNPGRGRFSIVEPESEPASLPAPMGRLA